MFSPNVVGTANAFAGSWGTAGALSTPNSLRVGSARISAVLALVESVVHHGGRRSCVQAQWLPIATGIVPVLTIARLPSYKIFAIFQGSHVRY